MIRRPPRFTRTATLFPYTTLFRSTDGRSADGGTASAMGIAHGPRSPRLALFIGPAFSPVAHCIEDVEQILAFRGQAIFVARRPLLIGVAFDHQIGRAHV